MLDVLVLDVDAGCGSTGGACAAGGCAGSFMLIWLKCVMWKE